MENNATQVMHAAKLLRLNLKCILINTYFLKVLILILTTSSLAAKFAFCNKKLEL